MLHEVQSATSCNLKFRYLYIIDYSAPNNRAKPNNRTAPRYAVNTLGA